MLRVLVVEDDSHKSACILATIDAAVGSEVVAIDTAVNASQGASHLREHDYDLLVLDLMIPLREGDEPREDGGLYLLQQLKIRAGRLPRHVVGLTAYPQLGGAQAQHFHADLWHVLHFDASSSEWSKTLTSKVLDLATIRDQETRQMNDYGVDLALVAAVHEIELAAVQALPGAWVERHVDGDQTMYWHGEFVRGNRRVRVVAAAADEMGMPASAALAMKMLHAFRPRYVAMVGIAAGVEGDFGEVLIADRAWDYGSGKRKLGNDGRSVFLPAPSEIPIDPLLKAQLRQFRGKSEVLEKIRNEWHEPMETQLKTQLGAFASGASVLADRSVIEHISTDLQRKLVGVDMEAYGVLCAVRVCPPPKASAMIVKSLCDFGDENKDDAYQAYAAYTSARFVYEFALEYIAPVTDRGRGPLAST